MNRNNTAYILMLILMIAVGYIALSSYFMTRTDHDIIDINTFPMNMGDWKGESIPISERDYNILETKNLFVRNYENEKTGEKVNLFIVYSETNRSVFHPPEVCLRGDGYTFTGKTSEKMDDIMVNKLEIEKNGVKRMALYSYSAGDMFTDKYYLQQAYFAVNQLLHKARGGATIRVMGSVIGAEEETFATLQDFMSTVVKELRHLTSS